MNSQRIIALIGVVAMLSACAGRPLESASQPPIYPPGARQESMPTSPAASLETEIPESESEPDLSPKLYRGDGQFVKRPPRAPTGREEGEITLNFEDTDLQEVIKVILGDLLEENYVIDPAVVGTVTVQSSRPLAKPDLIPILETFLQMNDAAMVYSDGLYKIVPAKAASRESLPPSVGQQTREEGPSGFRTQVVPLRYISAAEIEKLLKPFFADVLLNIDKNRNLLILAGTQRNINRLLETIAIFDVDWLRGMSMGLVPLEYAESKIIVEELENLFVQDETPLSGVVRFIAIERLNSVLVISQQPRYLDEVTDWIERLDRSDGKAGQRLYVYNVQNGTAATLAEVLNGVFGTGGGTGGLPSASLAPGLEPVSLESEEGEGSEPTTGSNAQAVTTSELTLPGGSEVRIIADDVNNALVILASPQDYGMIENALRRLDVIPMQVLIEASIIEITLTDDFRFGVEWYFNSKLGDQQGQGFLDLGTPGVPFGSGVTADPNAPAGDITGLLRLGAQAGVLPATSGFSYLLTDGDIVRTVINTLASDTRLNVLSTPSLMVLDNHTATINVGDEVPVPSQQQQSTIGDNPNLVNTIQYRETGVTLEVTPRVNASGLITMELNQEVSTVAAEVTTTGVNAPTFSRRAISSTIAVQSGNTIVLGGLIEEDDLESEQGIPGLYKLPVIGRLFGSTINSSSRRELLVLITPRAVRSEQESREVTEEFRRKLKRLDPNRR